MAFLLIGAALVYIIFDSGKLLDNSKSKTYSKINSRDARIAKLSAKICLIILFILAVCEIMIRGGEVMRILHSILGLILIISGAISVISWFSLKRFGNVK
jgi:hypothetical protein